MTKAKVKGLERVKGFEIVEQFLNTWLEQSREWYKVQYERYLAEKESLKETKAYKFHYSKDYSDELKKEVITFLDEKFERASSDEDNIYRITWKVPFSKTYNRFGNRFRTEYMGNALVSVMNEEYAQVQEKYASVIKHLGKKVSYTESVNQMLEKEYVRKYERLVSDVVSITENVEKADLHIGNKQNIEGFVEGKKGKAELWSTLSGGAVQCWHFRFYCHKR